VAYWPFWVPVTALYYETVVEPRKRRDWEATIRNMKPVNSAPFKAAAGEEPRNPDTNAHEPPGEWQI
jgi:hypothetical protein